MPRRANRLQLERDPVHHRREWAVQRVGWAIWILVILAGLTGMLGSGPLSRREVRASDGSIRVEYDRFARRHLPTALVVHLASSRSGDDFRLWVALQFLDQFEISRIQPGPTVTEARADGVIYVFRRAAGSREMKVTLHGQFGNVGSITPEFRLEMMDKVALPMFAYP